MANIPEPEQPLALTDGDPSNHSQCQRLCSIRQGAKELDSGHFPNRVIGSAQYASAVLK